ncbi:MAG: Arm DNA-binding domain-containing protein, partial [Candidatus Binataceae bacterium]
MELTKRNVATLAAPANSNRIYFDDATWGLGLRVTAAGARSWVLNYTVAGKQRRFTLGSYPELSLQQARARASDWRDKIKQGVLVREADGSERTMRLDPLEERHRERERVKREAQERERREHEGERTVGR